VSGANAGRWFRLLLRFYPRDFREEMGEALVQTYLDRLRDESALRVCFAALRDSLRNGLGERLRPAVAWRRNGNWGRDLELVSRRLRRSPLMLAAILGTLTAGLGTFAVVYTAVDKILIEPLPYRDPDDLYMVWQKKDKFAMTGPHSAELPKAAASGNSAIEGAATVDFNLLTFPAGPNSDASRVLGMRTSPNLFDLLGVQPALGRGFRPEETGPNSPDVIVLSDGLWKRLGGDPEIIGTQIRIGAMPVTVIGVMPPDFRFGASETAVPEAYVPISEDLAAHDPLVGDYLIVLRGRRGTSPEQLQAAVDAVGRSVDERYNEGRNRALLIVSLQTDLVASIRPVLLALAFTATFLVLVLTVNLASLLLARAAEREREFAVSRALGASGPAVVRATLVEGGLLGFIGGTLGALAGVWGTRVLLALGPIDLPRRDSIALDWQVAASVIGVGTLIGLLAAAVPAVWAARVSLASLLSGMAVRGGASSGRMRRSLVVVQVALSLVLLSAGGLVVRSFETLLAADPGFKTQGLLTFGVGLGEWLFPKTADSFAFQDRVTEALHSLPGVKSVSATSTLPLGGGGSVSWFTVPSASEKGDDGPDGRPGFRIFTRAGYFETMGMRLVEGRTFESARRDGVHEAIIDQRAAKHFFGNRSPLGATLVFDYNPVTIVGVVEQARLVDLYKDDAYLHLYLRAEDFEERPWRFTVRTDRDPKALLPEVRNLIRQIDSRVAVSEAYTMDEIVAERRSRERISAVLIAGLGLGALLLVAMGLFGMISGSVSRRSGELAIRMALGATHGRVIRLVVGEGSRLLATGLVIGIPGIYMAGAALQGFLIGISPFDIPTLVVVSLGLVAVALLACYLAARRVTRIEPDRLLREGG